MTLLPMNRINIFCALFFAVSLTGFAQSNTTETFNITGPTSVCADGVTAYVYSGAASDVTWTASGGQIIGSNVGTGVTVKWTSSTGSLSGSYYSETCWYNDGGDPPGWVCDTYQYASNPFSVTSVVKGGTLSGSTSVCTTASGTLTLSGHAGTITRWERNTGAGWTTLANTSTTYTYSNVNVTTQYRAVLTGTTCAAIAYSTTATVTILSNGGSLSGATSTCNTPASGTLTLSGHSGSVLRWEKNTSGSWTSITNTTASLSYSNITATTQYRAVVKNGSCAQVYSSIGTVTINPPSVSGSIAGGGVSYCAQGSGTLTLSGHTGSVVRWEYDITGNGYYTTINNTSTTLAYTNLTTSTYYRAVVKSGTCAEAITAPVSIAVYAASVGGTVASSTDTYGTSANGQLTLSGNTGNIIRWEKNTGSGWTSITNTTTTYNYNVSQTTSYRAVVKNGVCSEAVSAQADVRVYPFPTLTPSQTQIINYGSSKQLSVTSSYHLYQWYKDGSPISGATSQQYTATEPGNYFVQVKGSAVSASQNSAVVAVKSVVGNYEQVLNAVSTTFVKQENVAESASLYTLPADKLTQTISYLDGLGRSFQTIAVGQSAQGGDIIAPAGYSKNGLIDTTFLPYTSEIASGLYRPNAIRGSSSSTSYTTSEQYLFYQNTPKVAADNYPYARTVYRNTPDASISQQGAPGADWQPGNHTVRNTITFNNGTTYRVRYWRPDGTTNAYYPDNSVLVSITTDENNNQVRTYTNALGQTVLKQVQEGETSWLETYSIYDEFGRLKYQVPPKALAVLGTGASLDVKDAAAAELIYTYTFDNLNRLIEKKVPGAAVQYIIYDKHDRVVLTQDGNLRATHTWAFVKYDRYNRVVYNGLYVNTTQTTRASVQTLLDNTEPYFETEQLNTTYQGYSNTVFPTTNLTVLNVSYYDHYNFDRSADNTADYIYDPAHLSGQEGAENKRTRNMATGAKRLLLDAVGNPTANWLVSVVFYDKYDRPIQTQSNNHLYLAVADKSTVVYDFTKPLKKKQVHYQNATTSVTLLDRSEYDNAGRVLKVYRQINATPEQLVAQYEYNALGQVVDKKLHRTDGTNFLQSVDYRYNIRGWLTSINNSQLANDANDANLNDESNDYFGMELLYNTLESTLSNAQYYNGNIAALKWKGPGQTAGANDQRSYKYAYDKTDRLTAATFQAHSGSSWTKEVNTLNETMSYDVNGNISSLQRNQNQRGLSGITVTSTPQTIDNLTYTYADISTGTGNTNILLKVEDGATSAGFKNGTVNGAAEYTYNTDGSMTKDDNKGINSVTYNFLGKPQVVNFTTGKKIEYVYDAAGTKLTMKTYQNTTLLTCTNYSGSFVYEGATPALSFFGSPEGRVVKNGSNFEYQYAIADHQGNTRVVFSSAAQTPATVSTGYESSGVFENDDKSLSYQSVMNKTAGGTTSQLLNGGHASSSQVGAAKSLKVYPGDKVKAEVYAKYRNSTGASGNLANFALALTTAFNVSSTATGEMQNLYQGINNFGGFAAAGNRPDDDTSPKGFITILIFDKNHNFLDAAWDQLDAAYNQGTDIENNLPFDHLAQEVTIKEEGYVYVFVSNENSTQVDIHFDDIKVTHTPTNVIQYNEYYPFGLQTANSWTRENTTGNNFLGNGGTELNTTSNLYDLAFRNYDPVLGRMNGVDPMASKYASLTPYNYSFNDPVTFNDPSGADPWDNGPYNGSMAYYYAMQMSYGGMSPGQEAIMDPGGGGSGGGVYWNPATAGGYGVSGYTGGYSLSGIISSYNPNFGGPVYLGEDYNGNSISALPTEIARAGGAQSYFNIAYNLSLAAAALAMTPTPLVDDEGYSGHLLVVNGKIMGSLFLRWSLEISPDNIFAGPGPGIKKFGGIYKPKSHGSLGGEISQRDIDSEYVAKINSDPKQPWNQPDYPWYKKVGWNGVELFMQIGDFFAGPFGVITYRPWGYHKTVLRAK